MSRFCLRPILSAVLLFAAAAEVPGQAQQPSAAPSADAAVAAPPEAAPSTEIVGRVETHDNTVIGIAVPSGATPAVGDSFEVLLTTPAGERGRVGRGRITFVKNGVALGRLDEATGDLAIGLEVRIQAANPQPRDAATPTPAPGEQPTASPPAAAVDVSKAPGVFIGDDPRFPFVLQVERRGDSTVVRGMGRMPYSAADPTPIMAEFVGISLADDPQSLRGVLTLQPDGALLKEPKRSPWVGLYDPAGDGWQMMFSPKHVVGASRPGVAAKRGDKPAATATKNEPIDVDGILTNGDKLIRLSQASPAVINGVAGLIRMDTDERVVAAAAVRNQAQLGTRWNQARAALADIGSRMSTGRPRAAQPPPSSADSQLSAQDARDYFDNGQLILRALENSLLADSSADDVQSPAGGGNTSAPGSSPARTTGSATTPGPSGGSRSASNSTPVAPSQPPVAAADYWVGRSFDEFMADQWSRGRGRDPISYTLVPASDAGRAGQVARVVRDATGRVIEIVNYGSAPDGPAAVQGGTTTTTTSGGSAPPTPPSAPGNTASTGGTHSGSSGGTSTAGTGGAGASSGTPPAGGGPPRTPDTTSLVDNDGANRVPGSPPNLPPAGPGTPPNSPPASPPTPPSTRTPPPPPPAIPGLTPRPERVLGGAPGTGRDDGTVYDPNITVLVDEDSGRAPTQEQINAARAALARSGAAGGGASGGTALDSAHPRTEAELNAARDAMDRRVALDRARAALNRASGGGVQMLAKGPKDDGVHHHAPGAQPEVKKPHPLNGTWDATSLNGASAQVTIRVTGGSIHMSGNSTAGGHSAAWTADGSVSGEGRSYKGPINVKNVGAPTSDVTYAVSEDGRTMSVTSSSGGHTATSTWRRR